MRHQQLGHLLQQQECNQQLWRQQLKGVQHQQGRQQQQGRQEQRDASSSRGPVNSRGCQRNIRDIRHSQDNTTAETSATSASQKKQEFQQQQVRRQPYGRQQNGLYQLIRAPDNHETNISIQFLSLLHYSLRIEAIDVSALGRYNEFFKKHEAKERTTVLRSALSSKELKINQHFTFCSFLLIFPGPSLCHLRPA